MESNSNWNEQLIDVLMRCRNVSFGLGNNRMSKAAALAVQPKEEPQGVKRSKAASLQSSGTNAAQLIHNFIMGQH